MIIGFRPHVLSIIALGALALTGCDSGNEVVAENESVESVASKVAKVDLQPSPGRWETRMQIKSLDIPGMPAEMQDMMKQRMGAVQTSFTCLTPEEAARPDTDFFRPGQSAGCTYEKFSMGGGEIDAVMVCEEDGRKQSMQMTGTYGEETYSMDMKADGEVEDGQTMSMNMVISARRVGECEGNEQ